MNTPKNKSGRLQPASWVALSIALSLALGAAMHNVGVGVAIGVALGIALGVASRKKGDGNDPRGGG